MCWMCNGNPRSGSTTSSPELGKMSPVPKGERARPKAGNWLSLGRRDWRRPLGVSVRLMGRYPDPWVEVTSRGVTRRYPAHVCLLQLVHEVNGR